MKIRGYEMMKKKLVNNFLCGISATAMVVLVAIISTSGVYSVKESRRQP